ncbi:MAG: hypothetical protein ACD_19C00015G0008 [uncultured bacterium]|nr:MAG: hypothetical protein ACD_19C00015G0008 [uncultured bacterium]
MQIIENFDNQKIISILEKEGLVIFPCETVYGVAVDSSNTKAVEKLNKYKQRLLGKPFAIMCSNQKMVEEFVVLNTTAKNLYKRFLPGPVTVISKGLNKVAKGIESEIGTLGVRIPDYPDLIKLIEEFGRPIVATSANASYQRRPYKLSDILDNISEKQKKLIDLMIDAGELPHNEPSTVIDTTLDDTPVILRQGEVKLKDTNEVFSRSEENTQNVAKELWQKYESYNNERPIIFALEGQMGAGKTQFVKGLAKAMQIDEKVTSPSYDLLNTYEKLTHIDVWRMIDPNSELAELDLKSLLKNNKIIAIEWADRAIEEIKKYSDDAIIIWVKINYPSTSSGQENDRLISWGNI